MQNIITERHKLPSITFANEGGVFDLLDDAVTLKLPENETTSFYFKIDNLLEFINSKVFLIVTFINPETGKVDYLKQKIEL